MVMSSEIPQQMFAIVPLTDCPHIAQVASVPPGDVDVKAKCNKCANIGENWVCLTCYEVNCSRFVDGHAVDHSEKSDHPIALSFSDLSVWCYSCNAYLDNEAFAAVIGAGRKSKFGQNDGPSTSEK